MIPIDFYTKFAQLVAGNRRSKKMLEALAPWNSRLRAFLEGLIDSDFESDDDAEKSIYGSIQENTKYNVLRTRATDTLISAFLSIDLDSEEHSPIRRQKLELYKMQACVSTLISMGEYSVYYQLLKKLLIKSKKLGLTDLVIFSLTNLRHYSIICSNLKEYNHYDAELKIFRIIAEAEASALDAQNELRMRIAIDGSQLKQAERLHFENLVAKVIKWKSQFATPRLAQYYFDLSSALAYKTNDFEKLLKSTNDYKEWLLRKSNKSFRSEPKEARINFYLLVGSYYKRDICSAKSFGRTALHLYRTGSRDWYTTAEFLFECFFLDGEYNKALKLHQKAVSCPSFVKQGEQNKESWRIYELYLRYVLPEVFDGDIRSAKFEYTRFIRKIPNLINDKPGYHSILWIISILLLFRERDIEALLDKIESFYSFCTRNNIRISSPRIHYFSRSLNIIVKNNFSFESLEMARRFFEESVSQLNYQCQIDTMEILPFEKIFSHYLVKDISEINKSGVFAIPEESMHKKRKSNAEHLETQAKTG